MKLSELFKDIDYTLVKGNMDDSITDLGYDSRTIESGMMFVAIVGADNDGHDYIDSVIEKGIKVILVSKDVDIKEDVTVIKVKDTRKLLGKLSIKLFNYPQSKLKTIAITGTKGKTTVSFMIKNIIEESGKKCGLIGTMGIFYLDKYYPSNNTTPSEYDTIKYMDMMVKSGVEYLVMEVSSQALKYDRVNDLVFDYAIFTNLSQDHIGPNEHETMDDYVKSKAKLFSQANHGILNIDDEHFYDMILGGDSSINTYGFNDLADLKIIDTKLIRKDKFIGISLKTDGIIKDTFKISMPGIFSAYNAAAAILTTHMLGIKISDIKKALESFSVKGRVEDVYVSDDFSLLIDFAHNGVSTESILKTIREYKPNRIVTVFGCGGNRSRDRRFSMGEMAGKYSDYCIITEDNNRYENFDDIANDILVGIKKTKCEYTVIPSRKEAIKYAIKNGHKGDIIMLLGKGHEDYIETNGNKIPFDEREVIKEILNEIKK